MSALDFRPNFLSPRESREVASKQMLSFIIPPDSGADAPPRGDFRKMRGSRLFSLDALPDGAIGGGSALFNWTSRDIYDVDGLLLFRDQTIDLGFGNEWRVRTAASDLLRTPVWSVYAGPALNLEASIATALAELRDSTELEPFIMEGEERVRLVSYSYPKLGILCYSRADPAAKFVFDLGGLGAIPLDSFEPQENPESVTAVWSPYDIVVRPTVAQFRWLWKRNAASLPALPDNPNDLLEAIRAARTSILEEKETNPSLILDPQNTTVSCAAATARMILLRYGIDKTENELADAMQTGPNGATPDNQVNAINRLVGRSLLAELDKSTSFEEAQIEIRRERPFKTGGPTHARAVGGFKVEAGDIKWLHIYDPEPPNQGRDCWESWDAQFHHNFMYVRPL